jgi:hypothetical protein
MTAEDGNKGADSHQRLPNLLPIEGTPGVAGAIAQETGKTS